MVALDDVVAVPKPLQRLGEHVAAHPESNYVLGCHSADRDAVASALQDQGLDVETLYLGPFGRPEVRDLVKRVAGNAGEELLGTIMQVAFSADLPRNPFVLSALIVVLVDDPSAESLNESTILDSYTRLLLGMTDVSDPEGLGMDVRRRENLLGVLARRLYANGEVSIARTDAERFILDFFERKGWERSLSAGNILDDLIRRRVLVVDTDGVRFRHQVLQYLFVAKQVLEDEDFRRGIFEEPILHYDAVKHAVAIKRSDAEMLRRVGEDATQIIRKVTETVSVELFDSLQDPDQLTGNPDLDRLARQLTLYPSFSEMERRRDEMYEDMEVQAAANGTAPAQPSEAEEGADLLAAVGLLSEVIARSELVDDVELKTELTREAIRGWALALVLLVAREGQTNLLHEIFESISEPLDPDSAREVERFKRWLNQFIGTIMTIVVVGRAGAVLGISQLDGPVQALQEDADFMASAAHALLITRMVIDYRQDGWVDRLRSLREAHGKHPMVGEVIWAWAMTSYLRRDVDPVDESALAALLADIVAEGTHASGPNVVQERATAKSRALQQLRDKRRDFLRGTERGYGDVASDIETSQRPELS
jgi:hypothetical protein